MAMLFSEKFDPPVSLPEIQNDPRYEVGVIHFWDEIMGRIEESHPEQGYICSTRCIGFVSFGEYTWAVVRQHWPNGKFGATEGDRVDYDNFNIEPLYSNTTHEVYREPYGICTRRGVTIDFVGAMDNSEAPSFSPAKYIEEEFRNVDWAEVVGFLKERLTNELITGTSMTRAPVAS